MKITALTSTRYSLNRIVASLLLILTCLGITAASKSRLYASGNDSDGNSLLFRLNVNTGAAKTLGLTGVGDNIYRSGLAYDSECGILYANGATITSPFPSGNISALFTVDTKTGAATLVGNSGPNEVLYSGGLTYDPNRHFLFATGISTYGVQIPSSLYVVNPSTGVATVVGPSGGGYQLEEGDLAYDAANNILYATGFTSSGSLSALFTVNSTTGAATLIGYQEPDAFLGYGGLEFDPSTGLLYATGYDTTLPGSDPFLYVVNPSTGAASKIGPTTERLSLGGLSFVPPNDN